MDERRSSYNSTSNRRRSSSNSRYRKKKQSTFQKMCRKVVRFFKNNNQLALIIVAVVVVLLILILILSLVIGRKKQPEEEETDEYVASSQVEEGEYEETNDLLQDAYPTLNALIESYFDALKTYDVDAYNNIVIGDSMTAEKLEKKGEYIEDYENISCYTKRGLADGTYIVYVYYEIKFVNVETLCPALSRMYVCTNDDGTMYINNANLDTETVEYITTVGSDADVLALIADVDALMQAAIDSDEMVEELVDMLQLGASYTTTEEETQELETDESGLAFESRDETIVTTDNVRIRSTPTTDTSDNILMTVTVGTELHRIGYNADWSKVELSDGTQAYVSSQYVILHSED